jgi:hypothetical protein
LIKKIAGMYALKDGSMSFVWLELDTNTDTVRVYDSCVFKTEVPAIIAEGVRARGRWVPIGWNNQEMMQCLLDRGCKMLPDATSDTDEYAEVISREIWERMRSQRFKVDRKLTAWFEEASTLERSDNKIPRDSHPLIAATRMAIANLQNAKTTRRYRHKPQPQAAII